MCVTGIHQAKYDSVAIFLFTKLIVIFTSFLKENNFLNKW